MEQSSITVAARDPNPDFLEHLGEVFGWNRQEATHALGEWIIESKAGRALLQAEERDERDETTQAA